MQPGKILVSHDDDVYLIKLVGDVRVTLCTSLNNYIEAIFQTGNVAEVVIDMLDTVAVDSTTLGLLAKLAIYSHDHFGIKPTVFCNDESLYQVLAVMGLDEIFNIIQESSSSAADYQELPDISPDVEVEEVRDRVLEAHRLLSVLNERNQQEFIDLIRSLEQTR
ncbi:STAS domain-containing protein [Porticoccus sp.]|uniref:STAS domain-containing protein n=1 Tax=Porticoccus sp. TaxID=2024853 RepID=UPI000C0F22DF|nr:MAG: anti-anti-sigma factor [Porticoccus sp.]